MPPEFRVIDTGLRSGRENIAFDQALIDGRLADDIPDTIRFLQFPPTALVGLHQDLRREIELDHCREKGVGIARRITGVKDHPWKGLARSYTHYGTNAYYRKMLRDVGFSQVKGRLLWPFLMASRFSGVRPANPE